MPKLTEPYSFLLNELLNNGSLRNKIYEIEKIELDLVYDDLNGLKTQKLMSFGYNEFLRLFEQTEI